MKAVIISDIHAHNHKSFSTVVDGVNSRLQAAIDVVLEAAEIGQEQGCDTMLICGDIFHVRGSIKPSVFNKIARALEAIVNAGMGVSIIAGNHDMEHFKDGATAVDALDYIQGVEVFRGTKRRVGSVVGISYIHDYEEFKKNFVDAVETYNPKIIMIHQYIDDFTHHNMPDVGLTSDWLTKHAGGAWVFAGHYHAPARKGRVVSVGAPTENEFAPVEVDDRGCWIVDDEGNIEFHKLTYPKFITISKKPKNPNETCGGNFVRIKAKTMTSANKLKQVCHDAGAKSVIINLEKEFKTAHEKTVKMGRPEDMILDFIMLLGGEFEANKGEILAEYDRIVNEG